MKNKYYNYNNYNCVRIIILLCYSDTCMRPTYVAVNDLFPLTQERQV